MTDLHEAVTLKQTPDLNRDFLESLARNAVNLSY